MATSARLLPIETLRGLACVLLVFYHVVGPPDGGLRVDPDSWYRIATDALVSVRMPLFTFIAGFIYSLTAAKARTGAELVRDKARRLLLPLIFVGIPISLAQAIGPGVNKAVTIKDALLSFVIPVNHFWFLQSVFLIFLLVAALNGAKLLDRTWTLFATIAISAVLYLSVNGPAFFAVDGMLYLLPFFLVGIAAHRFARRAEGGWLYLCAVGIALIALLQIYLAASYPDVVVDRRSALSLAVGIVSCILFYTAGLSSRLLAKLGYYSFSIYLFHTVFAVLSRLIMRHLDVSSTAALVSAGMFAGLIGPILVFHFVRRNRWLAMLLLGERLPRPQASSAPAPTLERSSL